jgi:hypothetical protein
VTSTHHFSYVSTEDDLLRQVVWDRFREDKPAVEVRRAVPHR